MSPLQTCSRASTGASVCTQPSVTADASMPVDHAARWVGLGSIPPWEGPWEQGHSGGLGLWGEWG